ncbi:MAG TPA: hypothetical protein VFO66_09460 [Gemmatimonadaceae bacterium]|nr:hypothetical protein [Gemmatimonadaceae bacterium]
MRRAAAAVVPSVSAPAALALRGQPAAGRAEVAERPGEEPARPEASAPQDAAALRVPPPEASERAAPVA